MDFPLLRRDNALFKNVIDLLSCISTTLNLDPKMFVLTMNSLEKFDIISTETNTITNLL